MLHYDYYCRDCARKAGRLTDIYVSDPLQSRYQVDKFRKHTTPPSASIMTPVGVFTSASTDLYVDYIQQAADYGVLAVTSSGRRNFIHRVGQQIGMSYQPGGLVLAADAVRAVLTSGPEKVHGYPDVISGLVKVRCASCGKPLYP